jgi:dTDP-4-amino-4,6-dideoxygalactose transaminase
MIPLLDRATHDPPRSAIAHPPLADDANVRAFEAEMTAFCGVRHGICLSDGTTAIELALRACDVAPGDEVILPSHTYAPIAEGVVRAGGVPVFVDIAPGSALMDVSLVAAHVGPRTRAILPVHLYGEMVDMRPILALAERQGLAVVEETSQAHGATVGPHRAGASGTAGCFSFCGAANLDAQGDAGFVATNDDAVADRVRALRDQPAHAGGNRHMGEHQAAVLRGKLPHLARWNERRRAIARLYAELLRGVPIALPYGRPDHAPVYHRYVVQAPQRDELRAWLATRGIETGIHYPVPCHRQPAFAGQPGRCAELPVTDAYCRSILSLPMFPDLSDDDVAYVADAVRDFYRGQQRGRTRPR